MIFPHQITLTDTWRSSPFNNCLTYLSTMALPTGMKTENFAHPEEVYPGLIYAPKGQVPEEHRESRHDLDPRLHGAMQQEFNEPTELCWHCGLTGYMQAKSSYMPRLKILQTRANSGMWALGSNWILKDYPNDGCAPGNDYITQMFLRNQLGSNSKLPLVNDMQLINKPTERTYLLLMSRAEGSPLGNSFHTLSDADVASLSDQMLVILKQIRQFTASKAQKVDGSKLDDTILGFCSTSRPLCKKIGYTTDEWFDNSVSTSNEAG